MSGSQAVADRARMLFGSTLDNGRLAVQRLPTGAAVAVPTTDAKATARRLAARLLSGSGQSAKRQGQQQQQQQRGRQRQARPQPQQQQEGPRIVYVPVAPGQSMPSSSSNDNGGGGGASAGASRIDARSEALRRMRVRVIREYALALDGALDWQPDGRQYALDAPSHLPVAVQRDWTPQAIEGLPATTGEVSSVLSGMSAQVQRKLGITLPERALRGERGAMLVRLKPRDLEASLDAWVAVVGDDYVRQLVGVEPCVLAASPDDLLATLEALNLHAGLPPDDAVAYALRHPALIGLAAAELEERLEALARAVGLATNEARDLAMERPELLMVS